MVKYGNDGFQNAANREERIRFNAAVVPWGPPATSRPDYSNNTIKWYKLNRM